MTAYIVISLAIAGTSFGIGLWAAPALGGRLMPPAGRHAGTALTVPARADGTSARRTPPRVENEAAAGGARGAGGTWSSPPAPGAVPARERRAETLGLAVPRPADDTSPDIGAVPAHPRFGPLLGTTPPGGIPAVIRDTPVIVGGTGPRASLSRADLPVVPVRAGEAPWTGQQPVLDEAALAELDRRDWVRRQLPADAPGVTREDLEQVLVVLRAPASRPEMIP